ncbi:MAG: DUF4433 domain-containing protein [Rhizonema sp. PD37]|nr:DUF4433 domain-containing protein [Rhizonema sp. PD37]
MTAISNLHSIFEHGLLSHNEAHRLSIITDISDPNVQNLRSIKRVNNISLHNYVPFYFSPRNPMLYVRQEMQNQIAFLSTDPRLLLDSSTIFSDGNAAAQNTNFYCGTPLLDELPWNIINAYYWNEFEDGKRIKCAEVLVYPRVEVQRILKIFCYSNQQTPLILQALPRNVNIPVLRSCTYRINP